jgi:CheY-like chemotaxis protein
MTATEPTNETACLAETGPTVLYIEDALASIHLIRGVLKRMRLRLISAMQGNLGLEMAQAHAPDLILLDLHLPDISGLEVLHKLKADARTASIPVVVLTADPVPGTEKQVCDAGALACVSKPIDVPQFLETIRQIVRPAGPWPAPADDRSLARSTPSS